MNGTEKRQYTRVTEDIEAAVLAAKSYLGETASHQEVADKAGVPRNTVKYVLTDLPRLRRTARTEDSVSGSLKERIVGILMAMPFPVESVRDLSRLLGRADSDHDIVHVLHSLHKQGKVDFKEGPRSDAPTNIHMTERGRGLASPKPIHVVATGEDAEGNVIEVIEDNPTPLSYPLLDDLLNREQARQANDAKAMAYVVAAEAVQQLDPDMYTLLMSKADALSATYPSPIEREYLLYVANHP